MARVTMSSLQEKMHYVLFIFTTGIFIFSLDFSHGLRSIINNFTVSAPWLLLAFLHIVSVQYKVVGGALIILLSISIIYFHSIFIFDDIVGFFIFFAFAFFQLAFGLLIMISGLFSRRN